MTRREVPLEAREIFHALGRHHVDYLLIGGMAVQVHGHVRTTQDVDVLPEPDPENLARLAEALCALGARPAGAGTPPAGWTLDGARLVAAPVTSLDTDAGGVDIHRTPPGARPYAQLR